MNKRLSTYLSIILVIGLLFPLIQQTTRFIYIRPLSGDLPKDTTQLSHSWWNGDFQQRLESYSTDSSALQPACVRLRNQLEYSLFNKLNAQDIYAFNGVFYRYPLADYNEEIAFVGMEKIQRQTQQLKALKESWKQEGKSLYVIITSSKLHYYRNELPPINKTSSSKTNYLQYKKALLKAGISVIDADSWFIQRKRTGGIPTMAKGGVHWTLYGAALTMDSLIHRYNSEQRTNLQRVHMQIDQSDKVYAEDVDAINLCNLLFPPTENGLKLIHFPSPKIEKRHLHPIVISDSYFNAVAWTPLHAQLFDPETPFYYYFHTRFTAANPAGSPFTKAQVLTDLNAADCIIIITDIQNLEQFGFGFIEHLSKEKGTSEK